MKKKSSPFCLYIIVARSKREVRCDRFSLYIFISIYSLFNFAFSTYQQLAVENAFWNENSTILSFSTGVQFTLIY